MAIGPKRLSSPAIDGLKQSLYYFIFDFPLKVYTIFALVIIKIRKNNILLIDDII